jgi:hypothetical protein
MIINRDIEMSKFEPTNFGEFSDLFVFITVTAMTFCKKSKIRQQESHGRTVKLWKQRHARAIMELGENEQIARISEQKKRFKQTVPSFCDLTAFSRESNSRHSMPANIYCKSPNHSIKAHMHYRSLHGFPRVDGRIRSNLLQNTDCRQ